MRWHANEMVIGVEDVLSALDHELEALPDGDFKRHAHATLVGWWAIAREPEEIDFYEMGSWAEDEGHVEVANLCTQAANVVDAYWEMAS